MLQLANHYKFYNNKISSTNKISSILLVQNKYDILPPYVIIIQNENLQELQCNFYFLHKNQFSLQ